MFALDGEPTLINWSGPGMFARLYKQPFPSWVQDRRIYPEVPFDREPRVDWGIAEVLSEKGLRQARVGIELGRETWLGIPVVDFELLKEQVPAVNFVDSGPVVWGCRLIKSEWEIDCMRKACDIGGQAWHRCFSELHPGIGALEIQKRILRLYADEGADLSSEPPTVLGATGPGRTFQKGDVLYLDGGCTYRATRWISPAAPCSARPPRARVDEHDGMWGILFEIIERMKPGVSRRASCSNSPSSAWPHGRNGETIPTTRRSGSATASGSRTSRRRSAPSTIRYSKSAWRSHRSRRSKASKVWSIPKSTS